MSAALQQLCCCRWDHSAGVRITTDPQCEVHGTDELPARTRQKLEAELLALQEGLRDQRTEAMSALHVYRRMKRKFFEKKRQLEAM